MRFLSIALVLVLASCTTGGPEPSPVGESSSRTPDSERPATEPRLQVRNEAFGNSRGRLDVAIRDLKRLGFWHELTRELFILKIGSRLGVENLPEDGHLADATSGGIVEGEQAGAYCDLMFYVTAIHQDLRRWRGFYRQGLIEQTAPTLTRYWAMLLAHELTHCLNKHHGEPEARKAELRVRKAYAKS